MLAFSQKNDSVINVSLTMHDVLNMVKELRQTGKYPPKAKIEAITEALK